MPEPISEEGAGRARARGGDPGGHNPRRVVPMIIAMGWLGLLFLCFIGKSVFECGPPNEALGHYVLWSHIAISCVVGSALGKRFGWGYFLCLPFAILMLVGSAHRPYFTIQIAAVAVYVVGFAMAWIAKGFRAGLLWLLSTGFMLAGLIVMARDAEKRGGFTYHAPHRNPQK